MEKLIELLNEFEKETKKSEYSEWRDLLGGRPQYLRCDTVESELLIISKGYHFIKWLVENEKIDIKALVVKGEMRSGWDFENKKGDEETGEESWNKYFSELCLMILAIQDEPINFLISILK